MPTTTRRGASLGRLARRPPPGCARWPRSGTSSSATGTLSSTRRRRPAPPPCGRSGCTTRPTRPRGTRLTSGWSGETCWSTLSPRRAQAPPRCTCPARRRGSASGMASGCPRASTRSRLPLARSPSSSAGAPWCRARCGCGVPPRSWARTPSLSWWRPTRPGSQKESSTSTRATGTSTRLARTRCAASHSRAARRWPRRDSTRRTRSLRPTGWSGSRSWACGRPPRLY
mmetsp:Transcript_16433/g.53562  ORF Transcript_16433/g.53562 Transcript_16433/m.53562 type:complete len:228 (+) Transcript_16433:2167-2850(+)